MEIINKLIKIGKDFVEAGEIARELNNGKDGDEDAESDREDITGRIEDVSTA